MSDEVRQFLMFRVGGEIYAVPISCVREVLEEVRMTRVPRAPHIYRGVINLRGAVVSVADLRRIFALEEAASTVESRIVVVELMLEEEPLILGLLVDAVHEVIDLAPGQIEIPPRVGLGARKNLLTGMGKRADGFVMLLDLDRLFAREEAPKPKSDPIRFAPPSPPPLPVAPLAPQEPVTVVVSRGEAPTFAPADEESQALEAMAIELELTGNLSKHPPSLPPGLELVMAEEENRPLRRMEEEEGPGWGIFPGVTIILPEEALEEEARAIEREMGEGGAA